MIFFLVIFFRNELQLFSSLFNQGLNLTIYVCHGSLFNSFVLLNHMHFLQVVELIVVSCLLCFLKLFDLEKFLGKVF